MSSGRKMAPATYSGRSSTGSTAAAGSRGRADWLHTASSLRSSARSPKMDQPHASRRPISPPPLKRSISSASMGVQHKPVAPAVPSVCNVDELVDRLATYRSDMKKTHGLLAKHTIETTRPTERRVHTGQDLFADLSSPTPKDQGQEEGQDNDDSNDEVAWRIKFKVRCIRFTHSQTTVQQLMRWSRITRVKLEKRHTFPRVSRP